MKKILFVIPTMRIAGAEKSLITLLKTIDKENYKIDLLVFEKGGTLEKGVPEEINIIYADEVTKAMTLEFRIYGHELLKSHRFIPYLQRIRLSIEAKYWKKERFGWNRIKKYIPRLQGKYDVAISYLEGTTAYYVLDKVTADKKIGWIHIDMTGKKVTKTENAYYKRFDYLVTISDVCKNSFVHLFPELEKKICIIENIVLNEEVKEKSKEGVDFSNWSKDCIQVVTIGRLTTQKGIDIAIKACKLLIDKGINLQWHVYGNGSQKKNLEELIIDNKLSGIFFLEGMAVNPYPYMKMADVVVQPSRWEGKSLVLTEAKILGKAIVVTNYSSVTDQIKDNETGIVVQITPESIAAGIEKIISNNELRQFLENSCKNEKNSEESVLSNLYKLIDA